MSTFTLPTQELTVTEDPKKVEETQQDNSTPKDTINIVITGNLSEIMSSLLNKELKKEDNQIETKEGTATTATESLDNNYAKKVFIYANTTYDLEEQGLVSSLDIATLSKKYKTLGYECFVMLNTDKVPKTFRNSTALEAHVHKHNIPSFVSYKTGLKNVIKFIKGD